MTLLNIFKTTKDVIVFTMRVYKSNGLKILCSYFKTTRIDLILTNCKKEVIITPETIKLLL